MSGNTAEKLKDYVIGEAVAELLKLHVSLTTSLLISHLSKMAVTERDSVKRQAIQLAIQGMSHSDVSLSADGSGVATPSATSQDSNNRSDESA